MITALITALTFSYPICSDQNARIDRNCNLCIDNFQLGSDGICKPENCSANCFCAEAETAFYCAQILHDSDMCAHSVS
ncbi:Cysteine-rich protein [Spironucleus salmonicida]|uniref:Cysteine-rich protein n=1 Tax=Spironucleus salmonicida TaxID=348837 RepID=V6LJS2_9EUKA|nr:Cysteine-rich protein [Spironucleus salmonicida]|eukprot:EST44777.1 Cysteine-rich protein [Spironucleus salmonicida]